MNQISSAKSEDVGKKLRKPKRYGTFQGVFVPTTLTILGVILFVRHPWVVGNAGVVGALLIVFLAVGITLSTALSMSSMVTNIRIGSGGPFSIISQSLGLEIGGSIGIPLYLSQACVVAMYIFGFREGWLWLFPEHPAMLVDLCTFVVIAVLTMLSTDIAFKVQYVILAVILLAIVSIVGGLWEYNRGFGQIQWLGEYGSYLDQEPSGLLPSHFWVVFAVFFPAVTGVTVGANMSGELKNPRLNIPMGTIASVVLTTVIYVIMVFVAALIASPEELDQNYLIFIDRSLWKPLVLAGLLGATFSSALASFVAAPRILMALGEKNILPRSNFFMGKNRRGEPLNAMLVTAGIVLLSLLLRDLNVIAPLITMFFLITYAMINLVVLIEQGLGLPSYRPTLKISLFIPLAGLVGSFLIMFILNPLVSMIAFAVVIAFYGLLVRRELTSKRTDARSGLFTAIAQWATKQSNQLSPRREARAWQPELLIPVESPKEIRGIYRLVYALTHPKGSIKILGMEMAGQDVRMRSHLPEMVQTFQKASLSVSYAFIESNDFGQTVSTSMEALETAFFKPNTIFLPLREGIDLQEKYLPIIHSAKVHNWGLLLFAPFEQVGLGIEKTVNVWLDGVPENWEENLDLGGNDLALLTGLIICKNWGARLSLIKTIRADEQVKRDHYYHMLERIKHQARIPQHVQVKVIDRNPDMWEQAPLADLNIMELPDVPDLEISRLMEVPKRLRTTCMFTVDSGNENALL